MSFLDAVARVAANDATLTELDLDNQQLDEKAISALAQALQKNSHLTSLTLSRNEIGIKRAKILAEALKVNQSIQLLNLSDNHLGSRKWGVGTLGIQPIAEALKINRTLAVRLSLGGNSFGAAAGQILLEALETNTVSTVDLSVSIGAEAINRIPDELLNKIRKQCSMNAVRQEFALVTNGNCTRTFIEFEHLTLDQCKILAIFLKTNRSVTKLKLSGGLEGEGVEALAGALKVNSTLTQLDLPFKFDKDEKSKRLGAKGAHALATALAVNNALRTLTLSGQGIGPQGYLAIIDAISIHQTVTSLDVSRNMIGVLFQRSKAHDILRSLTSLKYLDLSDNYIDDLAGYDFANAIKLNHSITYLNLSGNHFNRGNLIPALAENKTLKEVDLSLQDFYEADFYDLAHALEKNESITRVDIRGFTKLDSINPKLVMEMFLKCLANNKTLTELFLDESRFPQEQVALLQKLLAENKTRSNQKKTDLSTTPSSKSTEKLPSSDEIEARRKEQEQREQEQRAALETTKKEEKMKLEAEEKKRQVDEANRKKAEEVVKTPEKKADSPVKQENVSIDLEMFQKIKVVVEEHAALMAMTARHEALLKNIDVLDASALSQLQGRTDQLQRLFESDAKQVSVDAERAYIDADPILYIYYVFSARLLTGTWMACQSITAGMVENAEKYKSDYVGSGLKQIGSVIPGINVVTSVVSVAISTWNERDRRIAVQRMANLFPDLQSAFDNLGRLARQLTIAQEKTLKQLPTQPMGVIARIKEKAHLLHEFVTGSDANDPIRRKAVEDARTILKAIKEDRVKDRASVDDLLKLVLGSAFVYVPPAGVQTPPLISPIPSPARLSADSPDIVKQLMDRIQEMEKRAALQEKTLKELERRSQANKDLVVSGSSASQVLLNAKAQREQDADVLPSEQIARVEGRVEDLTTEVNIVKAEYQQAAQTLHLLVAQIHSLRKH